MKDDDFSTYRFVRVRNKVIRLLDSIAPIVTEAVSRLKTDLANELNEKTNQLPCLNPKITSSFDQNRLLFAPHRRSRKGTSLNFLQLPCWNRINSECTSADRIGRELCSFGTTNTKQLGKHISPNCAIKWPACAIVSAGTKVRCKRRAKFPRKVDRSKEINFPAPSTYFLLREADFTHLSA